MFKANSKILIAYENSDSFSALSKCNIFPGNMSQVSGAENVSAVDFSGFWTEQSWGTAVTAAVSADIIIVSLSGRSDLPAPVQRWMENWPKHQQEDHIKLVVVFGSEQTDNLKQNVLISYFRQVARDHGLDFLCHQDAAEILPTRAQFPNQLDSGQACSPGLL